MKVKFTINTTQTGTCTLGDMATWVTGSTPDSITSKNQTRYISVTADAVEGTNTTTETRALEKKLNEFAASDEMPEGCSFYMGGGSEINGMVVDQMGQWMFLALPFVYLVMVAQFQSLLSPFIVLFTIPLAFTGGMIGQNPSVRPTSRFLCLLKTYSASPAAAPLPPAV